MADGPIRVLLVDDHAMVRRGMRDFLELHDDIEVVGEAADGAAGVEVAEALRPDIVVMDLMMPNLDGIAATARIKAALTSFSAQGLRAADLDEAKGFVLGRMLFRFETPAAASGTIADLGSLGLGADGLQAVAERVRSITLEQLNAAAARYYDPRQAVFVVAGGDRFRSEK